jgi:tryptophanyl-tRNA synthetase
VTDAHEGVAYDPVTRPGVANLLEILAATTGGDPRQLAASYDSYGPLKQDAADAVIGALGPIQTRLAAITADRHVVDEALRAGAEKAQAIASKTLIRARDAVGLLPPVS